MKKPIPNKRVHSMRLRMVAAGVLAGLSGVSFGGETLDVHACLPLLECNSIARRVLDVSYSLEYKGKISGKAVALKKDVHLVFDAETGKYRYEEKHYDKLPDMSAYRFEVWMWDGKEFVFWDRVARKRGESRALGAGILETSGNAVIYGRPFSIIPSDILFFFDGFPRTFAETAPKHNPKLGNISGDTITIETDHNKFVLLKKTGALERIDYYDDENPKTIYLTYKLSDHVERSGVWIPLWVAKIEEDEDGGADITEYVVDPKTLRLLDKVEDPSIFSEPLPAGCAVTDDIRKKSYMVKTVDRLPNDVEAIQKMLEKMLEQADEQKAAIEEEIREKKKKK